MQPPSSLDGPRTGFYTPTPKEPYSHRRGLADTSDQGLGRTPSQDSAPNTGRPWSRQVTPDTKSKVRFQSRIPLPRRNATLGYIAGCNPPRSKHDAIMAWMDHSDEKPKLPHLTDELERVRASVRPDAQTPQNSVVATPSTASGDHAPRAVSLSASQDGPGGLGCGESVDLWSERVQTGRLAQRRESWGWTQRDAAACDVEKGETTERAEARESCVPRQPDDGEVSDKSRELSSSASTYSSSSSCSVSCWGSWKPRAAREQGKDCGDMYFDPECRSTMLAFQFDSCGPGWWEQFHLIN
ncbi:hypothetical protein BT67DRAFT_193365 [Trichocladium antarcticum]|uniref:Uncharacterized protein n=1 Tax=Trichocladium antarcticum TaxID=1450529 RepID=A0AAN6UQB3_9PEZI|nr:hypothetical protein BT67DRAFT_193365 [Trichocladium antarcticum]